MNFKTQSTLQVRCLTYSCTLHCFLLFYNHTVGWLSIIFATFSRKTQVPGIVFVNAINIFFVQYTKKTTNLKVHHLLFIYCLVLFSFLFSRNQPQGREKKVGSKKLGKFPSEKKSCRTQKIAKKLLGTKHQFFFVSLSTL